VLSQNVELVYEATWQYMDLDPKGYKGRQAVSGDFTKLTFAPTFKAQTAGFFERASGVRHLDGLVLRARQLRQLRCHGPEQLHRRGRWNFGVQMETWF
jgi:sucrose porin